MSFVASQTDYTKVVDVLFDRIIHHVRNEFLRRIIYPAGVVRRITPSTIPAILAEPSGVVIEFGRPRG